MKSIENLIQKNKLEEVIKLFPEEVRAKFQVVVFKKQSILIRKDYKMDGVYILLDGKAHLLSELPNGQIYSFANLGPGCIVGDLEILSSHYKNAGTLVAETECIAYLCSTEIFEEQLRSNIKILLYVSQSLAERMFTRSYEAGINTFQNTTDRLMVYLAKYYSEHIEDNSNLVVVKRNQSTIASSIGTSLKTVVRGVRRLRDAGLIGSKSGKITITHAQYQELMKQTSEYFVDYSYPR